jgi:F-type H+-transporting ATPase subunit delta
MTSHRRLARRYVVALGESAQEAGVLDRVTQDLVHVEQLTSRSAEFKQSISLTQGDKEMQERVLRQLIEGEVHDLTLSFLLLLVQRGRLAYLSDMVAEMQAYTDEVNHVQPVTVITAVALAEQQQMEVAAQLKQQLGCDIRLRCVTNPDILGGIIIQVGKKTYDGSVAGKLQRLLRQVNPHYYTQMPLLAAPSLLDTSDSGYEQVVRVITAIALTADLQAELAERLEKKLGKAIKLEVHVRPEILGGLIIQLGDKVIDDSVVGRLKRLLGPDSSWHDDISFIEGLTEPVGKRIVTVTTAVPLAPDLAQALKQRLEQKLGTAIEMVFRLQPEMIGGVKLQADNQVYDDSVAGRLAKALAELY